MKLPGLAQFRLCTLSDKELAEAVAQGLCKMYEEPVSVPNQHIPAQPNKDFDLLVSELIIRFTERVERDSPGCGNACGDNHCDENGCVERKRVPVDPSL